MNVALINFSWRQSGSIMLPGFKLFSLRCSVSYLPNNIETISYVTIMDNWQFKLND